MKRNYEDWAEKEMEEEGVTPEEYCNEHGYNWDDITTDDDDDDNDDDD